jgi:two-component system response regulator HydG
MEKGLFREDLYYRLAVFPIRMPSLAERRGDIPDLVNYFLREKDYSGGIDAQAVQMLKTASWRGNVRELFNVVERATILASGDLIEIKHLPRMETILAPTISPQHSRRTLEDMERTAIIEALRKTRGNKTEAAKILGITRRMIYSRMKKLGMSDEEVREP